MAQTAPNFGSILDQPASSAERPKPWPVGSYIAMVKGLPRKDKSSKKQTEFIEYTLQPISAIEGTVDEDALEEFGGFGEDKTIRLTFYFTEKSTYRHKEFLYDDLQIEEDPEASHWDLAQQTPGQQCVIHIKHTPSDDGKGFYSEIAGTAPVPQE